MRIGNLNLKGRALLAPMAGVSNRPFRLLAVEAGAAMAFTEMISSEGIVRLQERTCSLLDFRPDEQPVGVQLFGSKPDVMGRAASVVVARCRPDVIDINVGCPVKKVVRNNAGAALLRNLDLLRKIVREVVRGAGDIPVTVKTRSGWEKGKPVYLQVGQIAEEAGVKAVTLHPRPTAGGFAGPADWTAIRRLKETLSIPVIGNGDIRTPGDAVRMVEETGCDAVMIGRAAWAYPRIFGQINQLFATGRMPPGPTLREMVCLAFKHARLMAREYGEKRGIRMMRRHLPRYVRGFPGASRIRPLLVQVNTLSDIQTTLQSCLTNSLSRRAISGSCDADEIWGAGD